MASELTQIRRMHHEAASIFYAGLKPVEPGAAVTRHMQIQDHQLMVAEKQYDLSRFQHLYVVGAGKATAPMASAVEALLGEKITNGLINVKYGHTAPLKYIRCIEAGHPLPDENGEKGAKEIRKILASAGKDDLVICLISGGGSALLPLPASDISLKDKQDATDVLLSCGARIHEINTVRKHLSLLKGGGLANITSPATLICLILSDVVGDDLDAIASGPTVPDKTTYQDCLHIFEKYKIKDRIPGVIIGHMHAGISHQIPETPKSKHPAFEHVQNMIVGNNTAAIHAAKTKAEALGYHALILSSLIEGETRDVAGVHTAIAREILKTGNPLPPPACIISGGETTVTVTGTGLGGRNQEFALASVADIADVNHITVLSGGTDGTDGPTDAAGAFVDSTTLARAKQLKLDPFAYLSNNDAYHFFQSLGDLFITGPTHTNVMDLRIMLVRSHLDGT